MLKTVLMSTASYRQYAAAWPATYAGAVCASAEPSRFCAWAETFGGHVSVLRRFHQAATSMAGGGDWIHITGMRFHGRHGVLQEETRLGQTFVVDVKLQVSTSKAGASDALEDTVNYAAVYGDIKGVVEGQPCKLLEAVAHRACLAVLQEHTAVQEIALKISKLSIPGVPSVVKSVGVEVTRRR